MPRAIGVAWTQEQRLIALNLYCKLPFRKLHKGNPIIREVALRMGRTPSSLALKLCNFASLDPVLHARGISGMKGAAREDKSLWDEFRATISVLGPQSEELLHDLLGVKKDQEVDLLDHDNVQLEPSRALVTFGDSDPRGFDILRDLRLRTKRNIHSLHMEFRPCEPPVPLSSEDVSTCERLSTSEQLSAEEKIEVQKLLTCGSKGAFEQESLGRPKPSWPFF
jgi:hypothetical protein